MNDDRPAVDLITYSLVRVPSPAAGPADIAVFSRSVGMHPQLVRRLVALGLLEPERDGAGTLWFGPDQTSVLARARRLRTGLGLSWAAVLVVIGLLDRIADLERELRHAGARQAARRPWS